MYRRCIKAGFPLEEWDSAQESVLYLTQPLHLRLNSFILISSVDKSAATPFVYGLGFRH